jgi:methyl-accepting chemotaxis protein
MGVVDQVTQRSASASEELASTAEEMSSQAESLQQLMSFFKLGDGHDGAFARRSIPHVPQLPQPPAPQVVLPHPALTKVPHTNAASGAEHGFKRF